MPLCLRVSYKVVTRSSLRHVLNCYLACIHFWFYCFEYCDLNQSILPLFYPTVIPRTFGSSRAYYHLLFLSMIILYNDFLIFPVAGRCAAGLLKCSHNDMVCELKTTEDLMNLLRESSKSIQMEAFYVFSDSKVQFLSHNHLPPETFSILVAKRSKLLRLFADFKADKEDEHFETDNAQVLREIAALEPNGACGHGLDYMFVFSFCACMAML